MNNGKRLGSAFTICLMTTMMINCVSPINAKAIETLSMTPCSTTLVGTATIGNEGNGTATKTAVKTHCDIAQVLDTEESKKERDSWNDIYSGIRFEVCSEKYVSCESLKKTQTVEDLVNKIKEVIKNKEVYSINNYDTKEINDGNIKQIAQNILNGKNGQFKHVSTITTIKDDIGIPEFSTAPSKTEVSTSTVFEEPKDSFDIYKGQYTQLDWPDMSMIEKSIFACSEGYGDIYVIVFQKGQTVEDIVNEMKIIIERKGIAINGYDTASINDGNIKEIAQNILDGKNAQYRHVATTTIVKYDTCTETPTKCPEGSINKDSIKDETKNSIKYETKDTVTPINTIQDGTTKPLSQAGSASTSKTFDGNSILGVLGALTLAGSSLKFVSKKKSK